MSKVSEFADKLDLPTTVDNKTIYINIEEFKERFEVKTNITKNMHKAEIWRDGHFVCRCSGEDEDNFANKLTKILLNEAESHDTKRELSKINRELCDYLTEKLEENGFSIINKASSENHGSYVIQGPLHQYQIKATYLESQVVIYQIVNDRDILKEITRIEMANPELEQQICKVLLELEK